MPNSTAIGRLSATFLAIAGLWALALADTPLYELQGDEALIAYDTDGSPLSRWISESDSSGRLCLYCERKADTTGNAMACTMLPDSVTWLRPSIRTGVYTLVYYDDTPRTLVLATHLPLEGPVLEPDAIHPDSLYAFVHAQADSLAGDSLDYARGVIDHLSGDSVIVALARATLAVADSGYARGFRANQVDLDSLLKVDEVETLTDSVLVIRTRYGTNTNVKLILTGNGTAGAILHGDGSLTITSASGAISFGDDNLETSGTLALGPSGSGSAFKGFVYSNSSLTLTDTGYGGLVMLTKTAGNTTTSHNLTGFAATATVSDADEQHGRVLGGSFKGIGSQSADQEKVDGLEAVAQSSDDTDYLRGAVIEADQNGGTLTHDGAALHLVADYDGTVNGDGCLITTAENTGVDYFIKQSGYSKSQLGPVYLDELATRDSSSIAAPPFKPRLYGALSMPNLTDTVSVYIAGAAIGMRGRVEWDGAPPLCTFAALATTVDVIVADSARVIPTPVTAAISGGQPAPGTVYLDLDTP